MPTETQQETTLTLLADDFRNAQFDDNLEYFRIANPALHDKICRHKASKFRLCQNPDGSENIVNLDTGRPLYPANRADLESFHETITGQLSYVNPLDLKFIKTQLEKTDWHLSNPLQLDLFEKLYAIGPFSELISRNVKTDHQEPKASNFLPVLRIYGIGLGNQVLLALQKYDVACLIVTEVNFDLFYCSLFITPWRSIFDYFAGDPNRHILLNLEPDLAIAAQDESAFSDRIHPFFFRGSAKLARASYAPYQALIDQEFSDDSKRYFGVAGGWYEDQVIGVQNCIRNIGKKHPFYTGQEVKNDLRVFLVGAGPSLNHSIDYIQQHQDNAVIIACGSAITPLLSKGIIPDIHLLQERSWTREIMLRYADEATYKKILALKLNTVETSVDDLYLDTLVFQKAKDPGSTLLDNQRFPPSYAVNPTVTNAGISISASLGANEVYLFGVDYGAPVEAKFLHADNTYQRQQNSGNGDRIDDQQRYKLKGNFSDYVVSDHYLSWSHSVAELVISQNPQIQWINVEEGADIKGSKNVRASELPEELACTLSKRELIDQCSACFDNSYTFDDVIDRLQNTHLQTSFDYLHAILGCFDSTPDTRPGLVTMIGLLAKAANTGEEEESYLPAKLFGREIMRYLDTVYAQLPAMGSDEEAVTYFNASVDILREHLETLFEHFQKLVITELQAITDADE